MRAYVISGATEFNSDEADDKTLTGVPLIRTCDTEAHINTYMDYFLDPATPLMTRASDIVDLLIPVWHGENFLTSDAKFKPDETADRIVNDTQPIQNYGTEACTDIILSILGPSRTIDLMNILVWSAVGPPFWGEPHGVPSVGPFLHCMRFPHATTPVIASPFGRLRYCLTCPVPSSV